MHIWCLKNLRCPSIAFRIKPKLLSIQWKANLSFFISYHSSFPYPVPKKATLLGPLPRHQLPQRKGTWAPQVWARYLSTGLIKYLFVPFSGYITCWRDRWKHCQCLASSLLVDLPTWRKNTGWEAGLGILSPILQTQCGTEEEGLESNPRVAACFMALEKWFKLSGPISSSVKWV